VTVHLVVQQEMPASAEATFDLLHDYDRRLSWDTLLRAARVESTPIQPGTVERRPSRRQATGIQLALGSSATVRRAASRYAST
jgi:hypothetical protein